MNPLGEGVNEDAHEDANEAANETTLRKRPVRAVPGEVLPILYSDDVLVAVHKPAGLLVHRSDLDRHETRFALQIVRDQLGHTVWPVHRLDKGTSGILLFALERTVSIEMSRRFEAGEVVKRYLAVVRGHPPEQGVIDYPLTRLNDAHAGVVGGDQGQTAVTRYQRFATTELPYRVDRYPSSRYALMELMPETGRWHQLRRHMKHIAHPIIGDATHGKGAHNRLFQTLFASNRLLLAAVGLRFQHPLHGQTVDVHAQPADDFMEVLVRLGWEGRMRSPSGHSPLPGHER